MRYFGRKLDRGRARVRAERWHAELLEGAEWERVDDAPAKRSPALRYLRFSVPDRDPDSHRRQGVFTATHRLLRDTSLDAELRAGVREELDWFAENLPSPILDVERAIFLFRPDAGECARRIWHLVQLLRDAGLVVEMQTIANPGKVVYEDVYQVAVVPWSSSKSL